jgi:hypothetical protein
MKINTPNFGKHSFSSPQKQLTTKKKKKCSQALGLTTHHFLLSTVLQ